MLIHHLYTLSTEPGDILDLSELDNLISIPTKQPPTLPKFEDVIQPVYPQEFLERKRRSFFREYEGKCIKTKVHTEV